MSLLSILILLGLVISTLTLVVVIATRFDFLFPISRKFPNTKPARTEDIPADGWRMGIFYLGAQGKGKSMSIARQLVEHALAYPNEPIIVFDQSESVINDFFAIVLSLPPGQKDSILKRVIYDELGHPEWVLPLPEFHESYDSTFEKQIQRVIQNFKKIRPELITETPIMGGASVVNYGTELFRLMTAMRNEYGGTYQLTEAKRLLTDRKFLGQALKEFGGYAGNAKWFFENNFMKLSADEAMKRIYGLLIVLEDIEAPEVRPRLGYHRPAYTFANIIKEGKILFINGIRISDQDSSLQYLFIQPFTMLMNEINKRMPHDPNDQPITILFEEVFKVLEIQSMAPELAKLASYFRSRKVQPIISAQSLEQLSLHLKKLIWSYGNVICFKLFNYWDAVEVAKQLFPYVSEQVRVPSKTQTSNDQLEPDQGQDRLIANEIRSMEKRECIVRRQNSESSEEKYVLWVRETKEVKITATDQQVRELKNQKLREYGVRVDEVNASLNRRITEKEIGAVEVKSPNFGRTSS